MLAGMWNNMKSQSLMVGMQNGTASWEESFAILIKQNILSQYNPALRLLDTNPNELKIYVRTKTCT